MRRKMTKKKLNKQRPVALLDVDETLTFGSGDKITYNDSLIETILASGIKDVYLFTSMRANERGINDRLLLIEYLKSKGLTVHGVISTSDLVWHQKELAYEFHEELNLILAEKNLSRKEQIEYEAQALLANEKYAALQNFENAEAGIAFEEGQISLLTKDQADALVAMVATIRIYIQDPYPSEKGELLTAFLKNKPEWVSSVIVVDDDDRNTNAVDTLAEHFPDIPLKTVLNLKETEGKKGGKVVEKRLTKQEYSELFKAIAKDNFLQLLQNLQAVQGSIAKPNKHALFRDSSAKQVAAIDALSTLVLDPATAQPLTAKQIATLRKGDLGDMIRSFVKAGGADIILDSNNPITTVSDFAKALNNSIPKDKILSMV